MWLVDLVVVPAAHAEHDELDSGGPPSELFDQGSPILTDGELVEEGIGLVGGEQQVVGIDRIQCPAELESRGSDPRCGSARQHDPAFARESTG